MRRERVSDDIYVFTSDLYVQVTASAVVTAGGIVVIDALPYPQETSMMIDFLNGLGRGQIRYLISTHWHGDHTNGSCLFENVQLVSHQLCAEALLDVGARTLEDSKESQPALRDVEIAVPDITFDEGAMFLHLGGKSMQMILTPGHTHDSIVVYIREDKVLLAADTVMALPYFVWGDREEFITSLRNLLEMNLECVVQGHGEILLRGEIRDSITTSIRYLNMVHQKVAEVVESGQGFDALRSVDVESCGKSRIPLSGLIQELHYANVEALYKQMVEAN